MLPTGRSVIQLLRAFQPGKQNFEQDGVEPCVHRGTKLDTKHAENNLVCGKRQ